MAYAVMRARVKKNGKAKKYAVRKRKKSRSKKPNR